MLIAVLLFVEVRRLYTSRAGIVAAALYYLNPVSLYVGAYWGQVDSIHTLFLLMALVARENFRVLKSGRFCGVLIGDMRRKRRVLPLGLMLMRVYVRAGFILKEIIIKQQHHCKMTAEWKERSEKFNFLLLAHEYLPIFEKPSH